MCGVAGIFSYHYAAPAVDRDELAMIRDAMINRGPDGAGEWFSKDGRIGLGHRRLAIIDLSEAGTQPMQNEEGSLVVSFNGEIYNYKELRLNLEKKGYRFKSHSDTEVLLHLYADKGEAMVHDLRGMFAFILWDAKKKALWMVRDPYGIKPLYYANDGWTVRVASQVKALLKSPKVSKDPEPAGIVGFFLWGNVPEPFTTYQEIRSVPAGSYMWVDESGVSGPAHYFSVAKIYSDASQTTHVSTEEAMHRIRTALIESTAAHLVSDVPIGLLLSSGFDSSCLAGLLYDLGFQHTQTLTVCFENFQQTVYDERENAKAAANFYQMNHGSYVISEDEIIKETPHLLNCMDQPSIDGINTYFACKAAKNAGLKVVLSGLGADELWGGYSSFQQIPKFVRWAGPVSHIPFVGNAFKYAMSFLESLGLQVHPKLKGLVAQSKNYTDCYFLKRSIFLTEDLRFLDQDFMKKGLERLNLKSRLSALLTPDPKNPFTRIASLELSVYLRNQLLRDVDWASMAHSLELRTPFVDAMLLKTVASIIANNKAFQNKKFLANIPKRSIPSKILELKKISFMGPFSLMKTAPAEQDLVLRHAISSREKALRIGNHFRLTGMKLDKEPKPLSDKFALKR